MGVAESLQVAPRLQEHEFPFTALINSLPHQLSNGALTNSTILRRTLTDRSLFPVLAVYYKQQKKAGV